MKSHGVMHIVLLKDSHEVTVWPMEIFLELPESFVADFVFEPQHTAKI